MFPPAARANDPQEQLTLAKEMATNLSKETKYDDGSPVGRSDYTFECTGVESCVQASIYVSIDQPNVWALLA